jgi:rhamnosyltransferase subunit B
MTLGSHGDVHPFLGIASALRARGHAVKVMASGYYQSLVGAMGLEFVPLGQPEEFEAVARDPKVWHWFRGFGRVAEAIGQAIPTCYQAILQHAEPGKTVLVYSTLAFGARLAQETLHLPGVTVHLSPSVFFSVEARPKLPGLNMPEWTPRPMKRAILNLANAAFLDPLFARPLNEFRKTLALKPVHGVLKEWCHSPQRVIGLFPEWFAQVQSDWPPQTVLTGFPLFDEKDVTGISPDLAKFLDAGSPPIVFTPGSAMHHGQAFFAAAAGACAILNRRGLLLTRHEGQIPKHLPSGVMHVPYAPFTQLLPRSAALVHHGGIGTTAQGLHAGIPQLIMPMSFDQPDNADRVQRLGAGDWLSPRKFTAKNVAAKLARLLESAEVKKACGEVTGRFKTGPDALAETARWIEELGASPSPGTPGEGWGEGSVKHRNRTP